MKANASPMEDLEGIHDPRGPGGQVGGGNSVSRSESERPCQIVSRLLKLVDLVIERLQADSELFGRGGLVAVVFLENDLDVAHLDVTQGWRALGDCEVGRGDRRVGRRGMLRPASGGELGRQVFGTDRAITGEN